MRTALLVRLEDVSGSSGTGIVGEIVQFSNGWCILFWLTEITSFKFFPSIEEMDAVHSHQGRTKIIWRDEIHKLQEELDEDDPLLELIVGIKDRRVATAEQSRIPPGTWREAIEDKLNSGDIKAEITINSKMVPAEPQVEHWQQCERALFTVRDMLHDLSDALREGMVTTNNLSSPVEEVFAVANNALQGQPTPDWHDPFVANEGDEDAGPDRG